MCWLGPGGIRIYQAGGSWREVVADSALTGTARNLTGAILLMYPELRLADVMAVIPACCAAGLSGPVIGACQTIDTGLAAIDVRGPGWVDIHYPLDVVVPELVEAGFGPHDIVALFNGNVIPDDLAAAIRAFYPDYEPDADDETIDVLARRWRCWLPCCRVRRRRGPFAAIAGIAQRMTGGAWAMSRGGPPRQRDLDQLYHQELGPSRDPHGGQAR